MEEINEWVDWIVETKDYEQDQHVGGKIVLGDSEHEKIGQTQILIHWLFLI